MPSPLDCRDYCLSRSWRLRRFRGTSAGLIDQAVSVIDTANVNFDTEYGREYLRNRLVRTARKQRAGNPIALFIITNILIPIIIKLVIAWWEKRQK